MLTSASSMVFSGGTSEKNSKGISVANGSKWNTFISPDIEGNSADVAGVDVTDDGQSNYYINGLYSSPCTSGGGCNSVLGGGSEGGQFILGDAGPFTGVSGTFNVLGNNPNFQASEGLTSLWNATSKSLAVPIITSDSPAPSFYPGPGITSVTCGDESGQAPGCTSARGTIKVVNSSASTTEAFAEIIFGSALPAKPSCTFSQAGGTSTFLGLFPAGVATTALYIGNTASLSGLTTFYVSYVCTL